MITRKQWDDYIWHLHQFKAAGKDMYIFGQRIVGVDVKDKTFATTNYLKDEEGKFTRVKFSFEGSVNQHTRLKDLYEKVTFTVSVAELKWGDIRNEELVSKVLGSGKLPYEVSL